MCSCCSKTIYDNSWVILEKWVAKPQLEISSCGCTPQAIHSTEWKKDTKQSKTQGKVDQVEGGVGALWCSLVLSIATWCSLVLPGVLWCSLVLSGAPWCSLGLPGALWCSLVLSGHLWCCLVLPGALWCFIGFPGAPWCSMVLPGAPKRHKLPHAIDERHTNSFCSFCNFFVQNV